MKSSTSRDAMNARVSEAFKKWPSFSDMPELYKSQLPRRLIPVRPDPREQPDYINSLYAACTDGAPIGREGAAIVIEPVTGDDDEMLPAPAPRGHRLKAQPGQAKQDGAPLGSKSK